MFERELCLVILFPVRRVHDKSKVLWNKIGELINSNSTLRLVLIDKTINSEATKFFLSLGMNGKIQFLQCDPTESIFLSQSKIKLPSDHWVSQIHDDDDFAGQVIFPSRANNSSVLQPKIRITTPRLATMSYKVPKSKLPASILFSFIPSEIWNLFTDYIRAQGEECSPSLDVALNFVCEKKFQFVEMPSFEYIYHYEHWQSRKHAKKSISNYMDHDGWEFTATLSLRNLLPKLTNCFFRFGVTAVYSFMIKRDFYKVPLNRSRQQGDIYSEFKLRSYICSF